jgi:hypothetical protein
MPVAAIHQGSTRKIRRPAQAARPHSEADLYAEIVRAWWRMYPEHLDHPMQRFVIARDFAQTVCSETMENPADTRPGYH